MLAALRQHTAWEPAAVAELSRVYDETAAVRRDAALKIWRKAQKPAGTVVETYLRFRAVNLPPAGSEAIRFAALKHPAGESWPAMLALVTDAETRAPLAIHRTFLAHDGRGKAPVEPAKMMLGPKKGGVIRLVSDEDIETRIAYAEGIETALTAIEAGWPCWAAADAGNLAALPVWPAINLTIFADHDPAGLKAAETLASRWLEASGSALIAQAPRPGEDWNDRAMRGRA